MICAKFLRPNFVKDGAGEAKHNKNEKQHQDLRVGHFVNGGALKSFKNLI